MKMNDEIEENQAQDAGRGLTAIQLGGSRSFKTTWKLRFAVSDGGVAWIGKLQFLGV